MASDKWPYAVCVDTQSCSGEKKTTTANGSKRKRGKTRSTRDPYPEPVGPQFGGQLITFINQAPDVIGEAQPPSHVHTHTHTHTHSHTHTHTHTHTLL